MLPDYVREDIKWWCEEAVSDFRSASLPYVTHAMFTDASMSGWGVVLGDRQIGDQWSPEEQTWHTNELEPQAVLNGLDCLLGEIQNAHVLIKCDNTPAVAFITKMGGCRSTSCNELAQNIWPWASAHKSWLTAEFFSR